jgi:hypothetical protein
MRNGGVLVRFVIPARPPILMVGLSAICLVGKILTGIPARTPEASNQRHLCLAKKQRQNKAGLLLFLVGLCIIVADGNTLRKRTNVPELDRR